MSMVLLALAAAQSLASPVDMPASSDPRQPVSLWIGSDSALSFRFGDALGRALAASPAARQASPAEARHRLVLRQLIRPRTRFAYTVDLFAPRGAGRERRIGSWSGRCTAETLDACATEAVGRLSRYMGRMS